MAKFVTTLSIFAILIVMAIAQVQTDKSSTTVGDKKDLQTASSFLGGFYGGYGFPYGGYGYGYGIPYGYGYGYRTYGYGYPFYGGYY